MLSWDPAKGLLSPDVDLGPGYVIDDGVLIGYPTGRKIAVPRTVIGPGARLRSGTIIYAGSTIGRNLETGHGTIIREENTIGDDVQIWSYSVIEYGCRIGSRVKIHGLTIMGQFTTVEDDVFISARVVIANDVHPGCPMAHDCMQGPIIRRGAQIGAGVALLPRIEIGEYALIGAGSVVTHDIPPYAVAYGNPARVHGTIQELTCRTGRREKPYAHLLGS